MKVDHSLTLEIKFSSIKVLKNDNVLISEPGSNDLVVYNTKFEETKRITGIKGDCFGIDYLNADNEAIRSSVTSNDGDKYFVWFKGGSLISIVDTDTLDYYDVDMMTSKVSLL